MEEDIYEKARKNVKKKKGFISHLLVYVLSLGIIYTATVTQSEGRDYLPVIVVALGWGIAIALHYFSVFGTKHLDFLGISANWEEEELEDELDRLRRNKQLKEQILTEKGQLERLEQLELEELERLELKEIEERRLDRDS